MNPGEKKAVNDRLRSDKRRRRSILRVFVLSLGLLTSCRQDERQALHNTLSSTSHTRHEKEESQARERHEREEEEEELWVSPRRVTLLLDQSVTFTAAIGNNAKRKPHAAADVVWEVFNVTENRPARISPKGTFTARLPGVYRVTAKIGHHQGHVTVKVPDGRTRDPNEQPSQVTNVSSTEELGTPPVLPAPSVYGPGWQDGNFRRAFSIENRHGRNPAPPVPVVSHAAAFMPAALPKTDSDTGINYFLSVPVLNLPGRGLNVALSLCYNSALWSKLDDDDVVFDHDSGWPAPGWSLGFGKIVRMASYGMALQDADGTLHRQSPEGRPPSGWYERLLVLHCTFLYRRPGGHNNSRLPDLARWRSGVR